MICNNKGGRPPKRTPPNSVASRPYAMPVAQFICATGIFRLSERGYNCMDFVSRNSSSPYLPISRPFPDCL